MLRFYKQFLRSQYLSDSLWSNFVTPFYNQDIYKHCLVTSTFSIIYKEIYGFVKFNSNGRINKTREYILFSKLYRN